MAAICHRLFAIGLVQRGRCEYEGVRVGKGVIPTVLAGAVLLATAAVARGGIPAWEQRAYRVVNDLPDALVPVSWPPMQFGALASPLLLGAVLYGRNRRKEPGLPLATAGAVAWLAAKGVKRIVGRGRPYDFDPETRLRLGTETDGSLGFVSGHAAVAMASAGITRSYGPRSLAVAAYSLAGIAGLSRVYAGAHLPIDVLGGFALGVLASDAVGAVFGCCRTPVNQRTNLTGTGSCSRLGSR